MSVSRLSTTLQEPEIAINTSTPSTKRGDSRPPARQKHPSNAVSPGLGIAERVNRVWLSLRHPFLTQGEIFAKSDIRSGSAQSKVKKIIIKNGWITEHKLQISKTYTSIWEPTDKAYAAVGIKKPRFKGKAGYVHQFIQHRIEKWAKAAGYMVELEAMLANGKAVDLVLRGNEEIIFMEIAVSPPLTKELTNVIKDLGTELVPNRLIIAALDGKAKRELERLIAADSRIAEYRDVIEVSLAGSFLVH